MKLKDLCILDVASCKREATVAEAARLMRQCHTGDLIVLDETDGSREPVGIITDRDIVMQVVAQGRDPNHTLVADVMAAPLVVAGTSEDTDTAIERMRSHGVRRLPVINDAGEIAGILTLDDFQRYFADQSATLAAVVTKGQTRESRGKR